MDSFEIVDSINDSLNSLKDWNYQLYLQWMDQLFDDGCAIWSMWNEDTYAKIDNDAMLAFNLVS